jgi:DNA-binding CsgD family transcriptional regulator
MTIAGCDEIRSLPEKRCVVGGRREVAATAWRELGGTARQALPHLHAVGENGSGPAYLYMSALDQHGQVLLVSFSLGRLIVLTPAELEVARWAHAEHSNGVIARERHTARHTVAGQMASLMFFSQAIPQDRSLAWRVCPTAI